MVRAVVIIVCLLVAIEVRCAVSGAVFSALADLLRTGTVSASQGAVEDTGILGLPDRAHAVAAGPTIHGTARRILAALADSIGACGRAVLGAHCLFLPFAADVVTTGNTVLGAVDRVLSGYAEGITASRAALFTAGRQTVSGAASTLDTVLVRGAEPIAAEAAICGAVVHVLYTHAKPVAAVGNAILQQFPAKAETIVAVVSVRAFLPVVAVGPVVAGSVHALSLVADVYCTGIIVVFA